VRAWGAFRASKALPWRSILPTLLVLSAFAGLAGGVNYARWGDPFTFIPLELQDHGHAMFPDRLPRIQNQGAFYLGRIPFGLQYYFAPIWEFQLPDGRLLFEHAQVRDFEVVELPPSSLFLSDPTACFFAVVGAFTLLLRSGRTLSFATATGALVGLAVPAGAMLGAMAMAFRYRMEFYPMLDFAAAVGLFAVATRPAGFPKLALPGLAACGAVGAMVATSSWLLYNLSPFGSATDLDLSRGWSGLYEQMSKGQRPAEVGHLLPSGKRTRQIYDLDTKGPAQF
jgi:hypothetical protein